MVCERRLGWLHLDKLTAQPTRRKTCRLQGLTYQPYAGQINYLQQREAVRSDGRWGDPRLCLADRVVLRDR